MQPGYFDDVAVILEAIAIFFFLQSLSGGNPGERQAYEILTSGSVRAWFWWGFIAIGIVSPLASSVFGLVTRKEIAGCFTSGSLVPFSEGRCCVSSWCLEEISSP